MSGIKRQLPNDAFLAALQANNPNGVNTYATIADIVAGQGNVILSGGVVTPTGTGLQYDVTAATYLIQGSIYNSPTTTITFDDGDADPRIDVVALNDDNTVSIIKGTPAPTPVKPQVDSLTQVEATFITIPAGATSIPATIELVYDENSGTVGGEWDATTTASVILNSTSDPFNGTTHIATTAAFGTNKNITFDQTSYTLNGGALTMQLKAKVDMTAPSAKLYVGFFVGGSIVGNAVTIGGTTSPTFGFDGSIVGSYQLVSIPITAFGGLPASVDDLRIFTLSGANTSQFDLDYIRIIEGITTPPAPVLNMDDLGDVTLDFDSSAGVQDDDGKYPYYNINTGQFVTSEEVNHGTVVINAKKDSAGTIDKGLPIQLVNYNSDLITVELADAATGFPCIGFTTQPLNDTDSKHIITFGKISGLDTTNTVSTLNPNGETWAVNDALYLSTTAGGLTKVRPTGGATAIQRIAKVLKVDATGGQLFIFNTARTAGLPNLNDGKIWVGDANGHPVEIDLPTGGSSVWRPNSIPLGSLLTSGATYIINPGAGVFIQFAGNADDTVFFNDTLNKSGLNYDGSNLAIKLHTRLSSNGTAGDTVGWVLEYAFISDGDNSNTEVTVVPQQNIDVSTRLTDITYTDTLTTMTGEAGAHTIMITLTRNAAGAGSDVYAGNVELISLEFVKV